MTQITPRKMLSLLRRESPMFNNEQAKMFMAMPAAERMELLFYMALNTNGVMQMLHAKIDPSAAVVMGMPDEPKGN